MAPVSGPELLCSLLLHPSSSFWSGAVALLVLDASNDVLDPKACCNGAVT